jgi:hypothetical protein
MPFVDMTNFNPNANVEQRNYSNSGVLWPGTIVASSSLAISPGTWKSGYPQAFSPFDWFVWFDLASNYKLNVDNFGSSCTRIKTKIRVFVIDLAGEVPEAVDVTAESVDWPSADQNSAYAIYDPTQFSIESVTGSGGALITLEQCDCELPGFIFPGSIPLAYGHTVAPKVFFGGMEEVIE